MADRLDTIERLANATAGLVMSQQELIADLERQLAQVRAELREVGATANGAMDKWPARPRLREVAPNNAELA